jgi:hypothetical protein
MVYAVQYKGHMYLFDLIIEKKGLFAVSNLKRSSLRGIYKILSTEKNVRGTHFGTWWVRGPDDAQA